MRDEDMRSCEMCGCLIAFTQEHYDLLGSVCSQTCRRWHTDWEKIPILDRPTKLVYYFRRKYGQTEKVLGGVQ